MSLTQPVPHSDMGIRQRRSLRLSKTHVRNACKSRVCKSTENASLSSYQPSDESGVRTYTKFTQRTSRIQPIQNSSPLTSPQNENWTIHSENYNLRKSRKIIIQPDEQKSCKYKNLGTRKERSTPSQHEKVREVSNYGINCFKCTSGEATRMTKDLGFNVQNVGLREEYSRQRRLPSKLLGTTAEDSFIKNYARWNNSLSAKQDSFSTTCKSRRVISSCSKSMPASGMISPTKMISKEVIISNHTEHFTLNQCRRKCKQLCKFKQFGHLLPKHSQKTITLHRVNNTKSAVEDDEIFQNVNNAGPSTNLEDLCFSFESLPLNILQKQSHLNRKDLYLEDRNDTDHLETLNSSDNTKYIADNFDKIFTMPPVCMRMLRTTEILPTDDQRNAMSNTDMGSKQDVISVSYEKQHAKEEELFDISSSTVENFMQNCTPLPLMSDNPGLHIDLERLLSNCRPTIRETSENENSEKNISHNSKHKALHFVNKIYNKGKRRKRNLTGWPLYKNKKRSA